MKEFINQKEYDEILAEKEKFNKLYKILKISSKEIIKEKRKNEIISYFCIASKDQDTYITFYNSDSEDLIQVLLSEKINIFDLLNNELIEELNVNRPKDGFDYRGFSFKYMEEANFIKQIFNGIEFNDTALIKEIDEEIKYYQDKVVEERKEMFEYEKTNDIINCYIGE